MNSSERRRMSRRTFLARSAGWGAAVLLAPGLAGCGSADEYAAAVAAARAAEAGKETTMQANFSEWVRLAALAPNGHNAQAWTFRAVNDEQLLLSPDFSRRLAVVDPADRELYISLGCALENLTIAAARDGSIDDPLEAGEDVLRLVQPVAICRFEDEVGHRLHRARIDGTELPIGAMLTGRDGADAVLLALAAQLEAAHPWPGISPAWVASVRAEGGVGGLR